MKALEVTDVRTIDLVDVSRPGVEDDGILIEMDTCGVCGTDVHVFTSNKYIETSTKPVDGHRIIGHEFVGRVVEAGRDVDRFSVGDRVFSVHNKGGMAEYVEVHGDELNDIYKIPDNVSMNVAATVEPLAVSVHAYHLSEPAEDDTVAIFGAGVIGLGYLQVVKAYSDAETIVVDMAEPRLDRARGLGADYVIDASEEDAVERIKEVTGEHPVRYHDSTAGGCDIAIDCAGARITARQMLEVLKPSGGHAIAIAFYGGDVPVDPTVINLKEITIKGSQSYVHEDVVEARQLLEENNVNRESLISHTYTLEDAQEGFSTQADPSRSVKVLLTTTD